MFHVYILKSDLDSSLYKGMTSNLETRLAQHNKGQCRSTKNKRPLRLVHQESFKTRIEAREKEKYYKSGIGREELNNVLINK